MARNDNRIKTWPPLRAYGYLSPSIYAISSISIAFLKAHGQKNGRKEKRLRKGSSRGRKVGGDSAKKIPDGLRGSHYAMRNEDCLVLLFYLRRIVPFFPPRTLCWTLNLPDFAVALFQNRNFVG